MQMLWRNIWALFVLLVGLLYYTVTPARLAGGPVLLNQGSHVENSKLQTQNIYQSWFRSLAESPPFPKIEDTAALKQSDGQNGEPNVVTASLSAAGVGAAAGFWVLGPIPGMAAGLATLYGATRDDDVGQAVRELGFATKKGVDQVRQWDDENQVSATVSGVLRDAYLKAKSFEDEHQLIPKAREGVMSAYHGVTKFSEDNKIPERASAAAAAAVSVGQRGLQAAKRIEEDHDVSGKVAGAWSASSQFVTDTFEKVAEGLDAAKRIEADHDVRGKVADAWSGSLKFVSDTYEKVASALSDDSES